MATTDNSYVNKLNPAPYSQAVFLTQKVINNSFSLMWQLAQTEPDGLDYSKKNPLKWFDHHNRSGEFLKFQVGKPTVSLQITTKDPMLYFRLHMVEGEVFLYLTNDPEDNSSIKWEFKNWTFAFSVKIERKQITKDSEEYRKYKERAGLSNSNFSLAVLFIDASSTTKWSPKLSDFGNKKDDWRNLSDEAKTTFENFIHAWLTLMKNKGTNILGYSAEREREDDELNKYAPTFPPTSIDYFCYPWQGVDGTQKRDNDLDTNALSYLMMSNFQDPPASGGIDYSGASVDQDRDATFVMSRDLFWPWLQSLLREVVIGMVPYPKSPVCYYDGSNPDLPFVTMLNFKAGDDAAKPSQYHFTKLSWKDSWLLRGENRSSKETAVNGRDAADKMILTQECKDSWATLKFDPGKELVHLTGTSTFVFLADHRSHVHTYTKMTFKMDWEITLAMASVEDGGLQFSIPKGSKRIEVDAKKEGGMHWSQDPSTIAAEWKQELHSGFDSALTNVGDKLINGLADHHRLFLPGKGSYLMKDPVFSGKGDLLVKFAFNGADPPKREPGKRHLYSI